MKKIILIILTGLLFISFTSAEMAYEVFNTDTTWDRPDHVDEAEVLVVGGGGSGGQSCDSGGGGAGGVVYKTIDLSQSEYGIQVGDGGPRESYGCDGTGGRPGEDSIFGTADEVLVGLGGGAGAGYRSYVDYCVSYGCPGGSSGGHPENTDTSGVDPEQPNSEWGGWGSASGPTTTTSSNSGSGGGGANEQGEANTADDGGNGGDGICFSEFEGVAGGGEDRGCFAAGGGGGGSGPNQGSGDGGDGGTAGGEILGGGGAGGSSSSDAQPYDPVSNTGSGGGGGGGGNSIEGSRGADGIVIIRYNDYEPPEDPEVISPSDSEDVVELSPDLSVEVSSPVNEDFDEVRFYDASDGSLVGVEEDVCDGCTATLSDYGDFDDTGTSYSWYVEADDGEDYTTSDTWSFTTIHRPDEPEVLSPEGSGVEIDSDFEVEVSHPDGEEMFVELVLTEDDGSFVDDFTGDFNDGVVTGFDPDLSFDTDYELEATASVSDDSGNTFSASESVEFGTELAPEDLAEIKTNNTDPENVELEFELDGSVDQIQLVDGGGDIKGFDSDPGTSSLIEVSESLDPDREHEWTAEIFKDGDLDREIDFSFTTAVVNVDVSEVENAVVYRLFRADEEEGDYKMVNENSLESGIISDPSEGLLEGEIYCYRVQGVSIQGIESDLSEPACLDSGIEVSSP